MEAKAEAQWVHITIKNLNSAGKVQVKNAKLEWGKFTDINRNEISPNDVNKVYADADNNGNVYSFGRENASSGTEGSFDIVDENGKIVCHVYWDCPWGSKTNTFTVTNISNRFIVQQEGANLYGGAIGNVQVEVFKKP